MVDLLIDDHNELREMVRRVAVERVSKRADDIDRLGEYPHDMFELLRELELFTLPFDKKYGGIGSILGACIAIEELGRICYNTAYLNLNLIQLDSDRQTYIGSSNTSLSNSSGNFLRFSFTYVTNL